MAAAGLDALEAHYIEHHAGPGGALPRTLPSANGLAVSGGSDYHGDVRYGPQRPGDVVLPPDAFEHLEELVREK